jgi:hypothetical protein
MCCSSTCRPTGGRQCGPTSSTWSWC